MLSRDHRVARDVLPWPVSTIILFHFQIFWFWKKIENIHILKKEEKDLFSVANFKLPTTGPNCHVTILEKTEETVYSQQKLHKKFR